MNFKEWLKNKPFAGISPGDLKWWSNYASQRIFASEKEARDWVFYQKERAEKQPHSEMFGIDGPEYNRAFADAIPIWQSGKSWKIGKRIRTDNRFKLSQLEVRRPSLEELNMVAQANGESDYKFHPTKWIPIRHSVSDKDVYATQTGEIEKIKKLAQAIKTNGWIEAIIYDVTDYSIIEGQHRARAMAVLGFKTVPGVGIEYL
jgi:hypothetical protein